MAREIAADTTLDTMFSIRFHRVFWPLLLSAVSIHGGCSLRQPLEKQYVGEFGRFEYRRPDVGFDGVVVGVPHGGTEPDATDYGYSIRSGIGAGLVIAYGFKKKRIAIDRPLVHTSPISWQLRGNPQPGSVYPEFKELLQSVAGPSLRLYVGVRVVDEVSHSDRLEVVAGGFSFEQLQALKTSYARIRDRLSENNDLPKIEMALNPLDDISWSAFGVKNHGVLMLADRGLILRLPQVFTVARFKTAYREILAEWVIEASAISRGISARLAEIEVQRAPYGRIDSIAGSAKVQGVVIAAPHGSFDWYTGELVEELAHRTLLPAVVTRGFTPTECDGWRINVNRPTERRYPMDTIERRTDRATEVYRDFRNIVFKKARGPLNLYIDIHQNGTEMDIEVATRGITRAQAAAIKTAYQEIRDRVLAEAPGVAKVNFVIEPLDQVAIGAWAAKDHGILALAKRSLHIELPAQQVFYGRLARRAYAKIFAELIMRIAAPRTEALTFLPNQPG
jgi:hypothetical protein